MTVKDTNANIVANIAGMQTAAVNGTLLSTQPSDGSSFSASAAFVSANIDVIARGNFTITLIGGGTPTITIAEWQASSAAINALNRIVGAYSLAVDGPVRLSTAIRFLNAGGAALANLAANSLVVRDSVGNYSPANLATLQSMVGKIASVNFRSVLGVLSLTPAQATAYAGVLAKAVSPYLLSQTISAAAAASAVLAPGFINFTVADTAANIVPGSLMGFNLRNDVLDAIVRPGQLKVTEQIGGNIASALRLEANSVVLNLAAPVMVSDSNCIIGNNIDALEVLAQSGLLASVRALSSTGDPIRLTVAEYSGSGSGNGNALAKFIGSYSLLLTEVTVAGAVQALSRPHVASVAIVDTIAHVGAALEMLNELAKAGKLDSVAFTDPGIPTIEMGEAALTRLAVLLSKFTGVFGTTNPPVGAPTGVTLAVQAYDWRPHAVLDGMPVSVASQSTGASNITLKPVHGIGAGQLVAEVWINGGIGANNVDLTMAFANGVVPAATTTASFVQDAALPVDWTLFANVTPGQFNLTSDGFTPLVGLFHRAP